MWAWEFLHPFKLTSTITSLTDNNSPGTENISSSSKLGCYLTQAQTSRLGYARTFDCQVAFLISPTTGCWLRCLVLLFSQSIIAGSRRVAFKTHFMQQLLLVFILPGLLSKVVWFPALCVRWSWPNSLLVTKSEYPMEKCSLVFPVPICPPCRHLAGDFVHSARWDISVLLLLATLHCAE